MLYGAPTVRRQDALRNRAAIVQAASEAMAGGALGIVMPEIARRAGIGQATLYRHFPDRSALAAAVVDHHLRLLETFAVSEACRPEKFRDLLRRVLHTEVTMRPMIALTRRCDPRAAEHQQKRFLAAFCEPLRRAQSHGYVRSDLTPADLMLLFAMVQGVTGTSGAVTGARASANRSIDLVLNGVCSTDPPGR